MKQKMLLALVILLGLSFSAHALPLWEGPPDGNYEIHDRSDDDGIDEYSNTYLGYSGKDYSGYYLGTISGNTNPNRMERAIDYYLGQHDDFEVNPDMQITKVDEIEKQSGTSHTEGSLTVAWDQDLKSGTWEWSDNGRYKLGFYAIKGGPEFALYFVDSADSKGTWTARHLENKKGNNTPDISHFQAASSNPGFKAVPEPASMLLFGTGLIGLAWVGRRHLQRRNDA